MKNTVINSDPEKLGTVKKETENSKEDVYTPFVNEECGDTMWDAVLEQAEKRSDLQNALGLDKAANSKI